MATPGHTVVLYLHPLPAYRLLTGQPLDPAPEHQGFYSRSDFSHNKRKNKNQSEALSVHLGLFFFFLKTEEVVSHRKRDMYAELETPDSNCNTNFINTIKNDANNITASQRNMILCCTK